MTTCSMKRLLSDSFAGEWGEEVGDVLTPVLRTANFNDDGSLDYDSPAFRCIADEKVKAKRLRRGDIILEKSGGTPNRPVGIMAYYDSDDEALCSNFNHVLRFDDSFTNPFYMFHQLRWLREKGAFAPYTHKTTGLQNLQMKAFVDLELVVPPKDEQDWAATSIRAINSNRNELTKLLRSLDELVKSRFVEMFGIPTELHDGWAFDRIDAFCDVITGNTPSRKRPEYYGDYIEWIKTDNITDAAYLTEASERLSELGAGAGRIAPADSVLMACIAGSVKSIGRVAIANRSVAFNQQINALVPHEGAIETVYLLWMLRMSKEYLCSDISMQLKGILNKSNLSKKVFSVPPLALQREFAAFVRQVDKLKFEELYKVSLVPVST